MNTYANQFPGFELPAEITKLIHTGEIKDISWGNDACPSFLPKAAPVDSDELTLWVDFDKTEDREFGEQFKRFRISDTEDRFETDDVNEAIAKFRELASVRYLVRETLNGLQRYPAVVVMNGKETGASDGSAFVDWFTDDEAARMGFTAIMQDQGYTVERVEIGAITKVVCTTGGKS